jgi:dihydrofolate reductase
MYIKAVIAMSLNGYITNGSDTDVTKWTSDEDKALFKASRAESTLIVMGKNTYLAIKNSVVLSDKTLRVVLTKNLNEFLHDTVDGKLEFSNLEPLQLVEWLSGMGYENMLLLGGSHVYSAFLDAGLINELQINIEPVIFESGTPLFSDLKSMQKLKLVSSKQLNPNGTLLLSYVPVDPHKP